MPSTALFVHVPVDKVEICGGPGPLWLVQVIADLNARKSRGLTNAYVEVGFTLRTRASGHTFPRKLKIVVFHINHLQLDNLDTNCGFIAVFSGHTATGYYNPLRRTGEFSLG